jgi:nitrite reductase/ring-hydroxylating ferredoxin subunit
MPPVSHTHAAPSTRSRTAKVEPLWLEIIRLRCSASGMAAFVQCLQFALTRGGPIADGQIDNKVVLCPLHLNAFELDTGCSTTGAAPLRIYPVHLEDGEIVVLVS